MPKPLTQEPDVLPMHAQVQLQLNIALRDHKRDVRDLRISFSPAGYTRAMSQTVPGFDPWGAKNVPDRYLGLPFVTDRKQTVDVLVQLSDGRPVERRNT